MADRFGWTEADVNATVWFNVPFYVKKARRLNAIDKIEALVINGGSPEARKTLLAMANADLEDEGEAEDTRTPIERELDELNSQIRVTMAASMGVMTEEMDRMCRRVEYLKVLKRAGRTHDGG